MMGSQGYCELNRWYCPPVGELDKLPPCDLQHGLPVIPSNREHDELSDFWSVALSHDHAVVDVDLSRKDDLVRFDPHKSEGGLDDMLEHNGFNELQ